MEMDTVESSENSQPGNSEQSIDENIGASSNTDDTKDNVDENIVTIDKQTAEDNSNVSQGEAPAIALGKGDNIIVNTTTADDSASKEPNVAIESPNNEQETEVLHTEYPSPKDSASDADEVESGSNISEAGSNTEKSPRLSEEDKMIVDNTTAPKEVDGAAASENIEVESSQNKEIMEAVESKSVHGEDKSESEDPIIPENDDKSSSKSVSDEKPDETDEPMEEPQYEKQKDESDKMLESGPSKTQDTDESNKTMDVVEFADEDTKNDELVEPSNPKSPGKGESNVTKELEADDENMEVDAAESENKSIEEIVDINIAEPIDNTDQLTQAAGENTTESSDEKLPEVSDGKDIILEGTQEKEVSEVDTTATVVGNTEKETTVVDYTEKDTTVVDNTEKETTVVDNTEKEITMIHTSEKETTVIEATENTEFVSTDKQTSEKSDFSQASSEKDPICSQISLIGDESKSGDTTEADESILPDTDKIVSVEETEKCTEPVESEEKEEYIVTSCREKSSCVCMQCNKSAVPKYSCTLNKKITNICSEVCLSDLKEKKPGKVVVKGLRVKVFASEDLTCHSSRPASAPTASQISPTSAAGSSLDSTSRKCKQCNKTINVNNYICWNTFNYCNDTCLALYQKVTANKCVQCNTEVPESLIGKYSVRFGIDMKQFCKNSCLIDHKQGQTFCGLCQGQVEETEHPGFCSARCFEIHNGMKVKTTGLCNVCIKEKVLEIEYEDSNKKLMFCSEPCFVAYKFVNKVQASMCEFCKNYRPSANFTHTLTFGGCTHFLCSKDCQKLFIIKHRKIVHCLWCNVKKYNFDMIQIIQSNTQFMVCSLNCYMHYKKSLQVHGTQRTCDFCHKEAKPLFHLTSLDGKVNNYCSQCFNSFKNKTSSTTTNSPQTVTQSSSTSTSTGTDTATDNLFNGSEPQLAQKNPMKKILVVKPQPIPKQRNMSTMCKPYQITKSINCKPKEIPKGCQTDPYNNKFFLPVPVPIYVPAPLHMYAQPVPMPVPFPLPVPIPVFIPTTRKSANGIMKEINKIKNKVPADPLEAELLMMAEMVAGDKKDESESESEDEATKEPETFPPEPLDANNSFGEDVLQMALKMANDFEEPVDLEGAVSSSTIVPGQEDSAQRIESIMDTKRRSIRQARGRKKSQPQPEIFNPAPVQQVEMEKPDANMCLKYTFGVNAWKQWVTTKNIELQKTSKRVKLFKTEILQLTADELNFSLCLFVKEVRKPSGAEYAPDTIYYLCLGIQQYLYENGRIDNIFCDTFYEKFTDCLNEVCRKFSLLYNESQYIVTRVEEEHLWESKQLGAHSPLVLLNTLMFFNTKHFSLTSVDEHLQLSFSHIMKHWKRNPNLPGARNVLLRFYPPQNTDGPRKKKVYEQQENEDNPLRCPVKLYEFYLSKCPESVKTRNDVFYLQPERSCVPDSPVWYSTMALGKEPLDKMLNRVKMVKEINVALLTT